MRVFLDPETGTLGGPTSPAMAARNANLTVESPEESLQVVKLPSGAEMLVGAPPDYVVLQIDANGKRVMRCVSNVKQALGTGVVPAAKPQER